MQGARVASRLNWPSAVVGGSLRLWGQMASRPDPMIHSASTWHMRSWGAAGSTTRIDGGQLVQHPAIVLPRRAESVCQSGRGICQRPTGCRPASLRSAGTSSADEDRRVPSRRAMAAPPPRLPGARGRPRRPSHSQHTPPSEPLGPPHSLDGDGVTRAEKVAFPLNSLVASTCPRGCLRDERRRDFFVAGSPRSSC